MTCEQGIEIIDLCHDLFQMIPVDLLNEIPEEYGPPFAFYLSRTLSGVNLLVKLFQAEKLKKETIN